MTPLGPLLAVMTAFAALFHAVFLLAFARGLRRLRHLGRASSRVPDAAALGVSILRPCVGIDESMEACLTSLYRLDYPSYEIVLGVPSASDPALAVIERVRARFPRVRSRVVVTGVTAPQGNPKVAQLEVMARHARHPLLWVSDSNTLVASHTLRALAGALAAPPLADLAVSPIAGSGERTLGAALENLHLGAFIAFCNVAIYGLTGRVVAPGKSMLVRRTALDRIGGFAALLPYLAEDHMLIERIRAQGGHCRLMLPVVANINTRTEVEQFLERHLRWTQMHWRISFAVTLVEPLLMPVVPALLWWALAPSLPSAGIATLLVAAQLLVDRWLLGELRAAPLAPGHALLAGLLRPVLFAWLWGRALVRRHVAWRGTRCRLGADSRLLPV
jgi:ceramide glucosyltransferase